MIIAGIAVGGGGTIATKAVNDHLNAKKAAVTKPRPAKARKAPAPRPLALPSAALLSDCPLPSAGINPFADMAPEFSGSTWPALTLSGVRPVEGGWFRTPMNQPPTLPAVPEPDAWAMMITGFGLIGLACRRRPVRGPA
ncbi:MAG: PEPxxWA-CTERM sorting domain-containing protein [Paracoccaceae bacterium]